MIRSDFLKRYSVSVKYHYEGSGVLVKADEKNCYLLTAKHNFKKNKNETHDKVLIDDIELENIEVKTDNKEKIIIEKILYDYNDLIIFLVDGDIKDLDVVQVLKGKPTNNMDYFFYGYPVHNHSGQFMDKLRSRTDLNELLFKLRNIDNNKTQYLEGFSGSGLFTEDENGANYLCGLVLKSESSYFTISSFNLSKVIDKINEKLVNQKLPPIVIKQNDFYLEHIDEMYSWIKTLHRDNFLVLKLEEIFGKEHDYEQLIKPSNELSRLNNYMETTNQFELFEDIYTQKLADMYLLGAFVANKYQDKDKALRYFEKARYFRPKYILFLAELDKENSKNELFKIGKIAYVDKDYSYAYDCFQKILSLKLEEFEKIIVYEYLVKIVKHIDKEHELIEYYLELSELYDRDIEKATVYYELSLIETKEKSKYYVNKGLQLVRFSNFLEIKYLLYKRLYELTESQDVYLVLKSTLEYLVKFKREYKYELSTLKYSEVLSTIGWLSYISMFTVILLLVDLGSLYHVWSLSDLLIPISILVTAVVILFKFKIARNIYILNIIIIFLSLIYSLIEIFF